MAFSSIQEFLHMGGYGFFVWLSFAGTFIALAGLLVHTYFSRRSLVKLCQQEHARQQRLARRKQQQNQVNGAQ